MTLKVTDNQYGQLS